MLLSAEILRHYTKYIDISIITIGLQSKATKNFHSIADFLKINDLIFSLDSHTDHPLINNSSQLFDDTCFELSQFIRIIIVLGKNVRNADQILLILLLIALSTDNCKWIFERFEILIGSEVV